MGISLQGHRLAGDAALLKGCQRARVRVPRRSASCSATNGGPRLRVSVMPPTRGKNRISTVYPSIYVYEMCRVIVKGLHDQHDKLSSCSSCLSSG
jgi:hypothetical protein